MNRLTSTLVSILLVSVFIITAMSSQAMSQSLIMNDLVERININNPLQLSNDYNNGEKWVAYFSGSLPTGQGMAIAIDLCDYIGLTPEGQDGWVTVFVDVNASVPGVPGFPVGFGAQKRLFSGNNPDDFATLFECGAGVTALGFSATAFEITSSGGDLEAQYELGPSVELGFDVLCSFHGLDFEIKRELIDEFINNAMSPGIDVNDFAYNFCNYILDPNFYVTTVVDFITGFRLATPQDDDNLLLTNGFYSSGLVVGYWGEVNVDVTVNESDYYKLSVRSPGFIGTPWPAWNWSYTTISDVYLEAGESYRFSFMTKPSTEEEDFGFWLYQKDIFDLLWKCIEKTSPVTLHADQDPPDIIAPSVIAENHSNDIDSNIEIVFSEELLDVTITNANISIVGSISGPHDNCNFTQFITPNSSTTPPTFTVVIDPTDNFQFDEVVTVTISTGVTDMAGNPLASDYVFDFGIGGCPEYFVTPWAGANGSISPNEMFKICEREDTTFTANPDEGFFVDRWFRNGIKVQDGGATYTEHDIQSSVSIEVWFKKEENNRIEVVSPNGGEVHIINNSMSILWDVVGEVGENVKIELWKNNGFYQLIDDYTVNDGQDSWGIPWDVPPDNDYKIRIISIESSDIYGESEDYFEIVPDQPPPDSIECSTCADLEKIGSDGLHPSDGYYILTQDIWCDNYDFDPIGPPYFEGTLDGQGYAIDILEIEDQTQDELGLFTRIDHNGVVKNLTLRDPIIRNDYDNNYVGGFAAYNHGSILNCKVVTTVPRGGAIEGNMCVGGIAANNSGLIRNCVVEEVNQESDALFVEADASLVGGIVGENRVPGLIEYCHVKCHVEGDVNEVGGIAGRNSATINQCSFIGNLHGREWGNGGIAGTNNGGIISNCCFYSPGNVGGDEFTGGIVGDLSGGQLINCYAAGPISGSGGRKGGLVGRCTSGSISNSFWDTQITGCSTPNWDGSDCTSNSHGELTSEMEKEETFTTKYDTNWDFENIWVIKQNLFYPELRANAKDLSIPSGLSATSNESDGVHLSWNQETFLIDQYNYPAHYRVYRSDYSNADPPEVTLSDWQTTNTFIDTTAFAEVSYYYYVNASPRKDTMRASDFSSSVQGVRIQPTAIAPIGISASDSLAYSITVAWEKSPIAKFYQVYRSMDADGEKTSISDWIQDLSYNDIPNFPDSIYYYWVRAAMNEGGGYVSDYGGPDSGYYVIPDDEAPQITISISPENPIETQVCTLYVSAEDNIMLESVAMHWKINGLHDSLAWTDLDAGVYEEEYALGAFAADDIVEYWGRVIDLSGNNAVSQHFMKTINSDNISEPSTPKGTKYLKTDEVSEYITGSAVSNIGSEIQYRFDWGDVISDWSKDSILTHQWGDEDCFAIRTQARSAFNTDRVSPWSNVLPVVVDTTPPIVRIGINEGSDPNNPYIVSQQDHFFPIYGITEDIYPSSGVDSTFCDKSDSSLGDAGSWVLFVLPTPDQTIEYVISSLDKSGNIGSDTIYIHFLSTDIANLEGLGIPEKFSLGQNYPNPFNPSTNIEFDLPRRSQVKITIYNILGQEVNELINRELSAGSYQITWDGISSNGVKVSTGMYFYRISAGEYIETRKMILLK